MSALAARPAWRAARALALVVLLAFLGVALARRWDDVAPQLVRLSLPSLAAAGAAVAAGVWCTFLAWRAVLADLGAPLPVRGGARVFFLGQLGKYLPGSVWPAVAQMELGRDYRVAPRASGAAVVIFLLLTLGTGLLVATLTLPLLGTAAYGAYAWVFAVLPGVIIVLHPAVLNRILRTVLRLLRREPMPRALTAGGIAAGAGWALTSWLLYGVHVWVLATQLGATGPSLYLAGTGAFAGAVSAGFLLLLAPAGAGVRELVLVLLLASVLPPAPATALALTSRLLFTLTDAGLGAGAVLAERGRLTRGG